MSTCQTWATSSHFRHPWLDAATTKRKRRDNDVHPAPSPSPKRRRQSYADLEDGFSYLSINANTLPMCSFMNSVVVEELPAPFTVDADMASVPSPSLQPVYSVEEPTPIPEVNMKTSSWYELDPNRIVITDLDSFTQSDDEDEPAGSVVNPVLLERIRANTLEKSPLSPAASTPPTSQALVLYKPLPWYKDTDGDGEAIQRGRKEDVTKVQVYDCIPFDDDAMDVEP